MTKNKFKQSIGLIALISSVSYAQTTLPPGDTPLTVQGEVRIQPEEVVTVDSAVNVQDATQIPSLEDTGNPDTFYVVQLIGDADVVTTEITSGGILAETNGNVSLFSVEQTETTVSYIRAVRIELENGTLDPQGTPVPVGGYLDDEGNFIELGVMTAVDEDGNPIFGPGDLDAEQLALITLEPVVSSLGGGNLMVGGDAEVFGTLSVGDIADVEAAIDAQADAIGDLTELDDELRSFVYEVDADGELVMDADGNPIVIDEETTLVSAVNAEQAARIAGDEALQLQIGDLTELDDELRSFVYEVDADGELVMDADGNPIVIDEETTLVSAVSAEHAARSALIRRDEDGAVRIGANSFILDDTDALNHRITTSTQDGNLVLGGGVNNTQVVVDSNLNVSGNTSLGGSLTVAGPTTLNGGLQVNGDAIVTGRLSVGTVQDVEASIIGNAQAILQVDTRVTGEVNRLDGRISQNARNISANRGMILENRAAIQANSAAIQRLDRQLETVKGKAYSGVAAAASLGTLVSPSEAGKSTLMAGMGFYEGEAALGVNGTHRLALTQDNDLYVNAGVSVTTDSTVLTRFMLGFEF